MNNISLLGRLVRDPDYYVSEKEDGSNVCRFTLAVNRNKEEADFISCVAFGQQADAVADYCVKGDRLGVSGRLRTGSYEKEGETIYTTDVVCIQVDLVETKKESEDKRKAEEKKDSKKSSSGSRRR